jgi:transcriptional regulator with XRE-family HTH domain
MAKTVITKRGVATKEGIETIAQKMVRLRKARGITQAQMAQLIGVSQPVVSDYERGALRMHGELIVKVAEILGVTADELLGCGSSQPQKTRAAGKVQKVFEDVARLPRRQQEKVVEFVSAFVTQYEQGRQ